LTQIDMPLAELRDYTGTNPRPADFDAYWDRALKKLSHTTDDIELKKASFDVPNVQCHHLYFTGVGGDRIHAKLLRPVGVKSGPAVLVFHGYSGDAGDWTWHLAYVGAGFTVAALDCRGQGGASEDRGGARGTTLRGHIIRGLDDSPDRLLFRQVFLDTAQLARIVMDLDEVDPDRVGTTGSSQGGGLALACAALAPQTRRCVAIYPFLSDYKRLWQLDVTQSAYAEIEDYFKHHDPTHSREDEVFARLGYIDVRHLAPRITADTMIITALSDPVCPPSTQFAAYNAIQAKKQMVVYPDFGHETLPGSSDRGFTHLLEL
jgi:cephalosporin-C deacetylase